MKKITERTLIPISLVITIVGGVMWLSSMHHQGTANAADIKELKSDLKEDLNSIRKRLDYIIEKLID